MLSSEEIRKRGEDRLQATYEAIERGETVDTGKLTLLNAWDHVQLGRALVREADEAQRVADDGLEQLNFG